MSYASYHKLFEKFKLNRQFTIRLLPLDEQWCERLPSTGFVFASGEYYGTHFVRINSYEISIRYYLLIYYIRSLEVWSKLISTKKLNQLVVDRYSLNVTFVTRLNYFSATSTSTFVILCFTHDASFQTVDIWVCKALVLVWKRPHEK